MQIDDITKAAQERLAALDAEAKPHEEALSTINAERDRLRLIVAAGSGTHRPAVTLRPLAPWQVDPLGTWIATGGTLTLTGNGTTFTIDGHYPDLSKVGTTTIVGGASTDPDPTATLVVPSVTLLS